jgi:two-component system response regulator FlrC
LRIPPLRERRADILPLAKRLMRSGSDGLQGKTFTLSGAAGAGLTAYTWRGNIRELENVIQRALILAPGAVIEAVHLCLPKSVVVPDVAQAATESAPQMPTDLKSLERVTYLEALAA